MGYDIGVPLHSLLRGTDNGECLKMVVGRQEFSTTFVRTVNHAAEDEVEEDLLQQVMTTSLEDELSPPCLDDVADYFSLAEEEVEFQDLEQEVKPETSLLFSSNDCHRDRSMSSRMAIVKPQ
jgi:hypothetical protein